MELAYAGLQQLCAPILERLEGLPVRSATRWDRVWFARRRPARSVPRRPGGLESALRCRGGPTLVCVVDDAQWLDVASEQALAFVARRLGAESVGLLFAVREPSGERHFEGLPELAVGGLDDVHAQELLATVVAGPLDERVRDRIVAETRGNPLALLELPRGRTPAELAGGFGLSDAPALSGRIEQSFSERLAALPPATRLLLLVTAAEPVGDPSVGVAGGRRARHRAERGRAGDRRWTGRFRSAGALRSPARAFGDLRRGGAGGAPARPPRSRRGHGGRHRPRSPRLASSPRDGRAR